MGALTCINISYYRKLCFQEQREREHRERMVAEQRERDRIMAEQRERERERMAMEMRERVLQVNVRVPPEQTYAHLLNFTHFNFAL